MKKFILLVAFIVGSMAVFAQTATIHKAWVKHNVTNNGQSGMNLHVNFSCKNMKGKQAGIQIYLNKSDKVTPVKDTNNKYRTNKGNVCFSKRFNPGYSDIGYDDFVVFIPYSELHLPNRSQTYYLDVRVMSVVLKNIFSAAYYVAVDPSRISGKTTHNKHTPDTTPSSAKKDPTKLIGHDHSESYGGVTTDNYRYEDGSVMTVTSQPCLQCGKTGTCQLCHGQGQTLVVAGVYTRYNPCLLCNATGRCSSCGGSAVKTIVMTVNPKT